MAKKQKKRNKVYTGAGASAATPTITRISAVHRSAIGQWWFDRKKILRPILIAAGVALVVIWLIIELVGILTR